ncbi:MAG TPA: glycosyltransferase [Myxococcales bacterium]|nr:glycosyltransferase [Myxococcales bacterium]
MPRVLLCAFDVVPAPTGLSRRVTDYLKALNGRFSVVAMTIKTPDVSHIERYQGARLLRVPVGAGDLISKVQAFERAVRRQLESEEISLVHYFDPFAGYTLAELRGDYGYRVLYEAHAFPSLDLRFTQPQLEGDRRFLAKVRRQELFCLLNADAVVTSSELGCAYLQSVGVPPERLRLIRAPVEVAAYAARATEPDATPMRVAYLGSQVAYQGLPTLLRAARPLLAKDEARLTVLGPRHPDWHPRLEDLVDDLALHGRVDLHPPVAHDDLPKMLAASDVAVLPLEDEERTRAFGGPLAKASEYLAAGRPIIASDLPITRELLPEACTLFFPPGDPAALGAALRQLAENPRRRVEMGRAARVEAQRLVDSAVTRPRLLSVYAELLGQKGRAATSLEPSDLQDSSDLTATPTSKVFGSAGRASTSSDSGSGRTPVSYLPRATANARASGEAQESGVRTDPESLAAAGAPPPPTARLEALGPLLGSRDGTDPAARAPSEFTPGSVPAPEEDTAITQAPADSSDSGEGSDSNITSPGAPIPGLESPERAAEAELPQPPAPSVVVAPSMLAEAARLGERPPPPTTPALGLPAAVAAAELATARQPAVAEPISQPGLPAFDDLDEQLEAAEALAPLPAPPSRAEKTDPTAQLLTPPMDLRSSIAAALQNIPTQPRPAVADPAAAGEPEEADPDDIVEPDDVVDLEASAQSGLPMSILDPWLSQVVHGYCPPEGIQFSRHTPPTTMPGREPPLATPVPPNPALGKRK